MSIDKVRAILNGSVLNPSYSDCIEFMSYFGYLVPKKQCQQYFQRFRDLRSEQDGIQLSRDLHAMYRGFYMKFPTSEQIDQIGRDTYHKVRALLPPVVPVPHVSHPVPHVSHVSHLVAHGDSYSGRRALPTSIKLIREDPRAQAVVVLIQQNPAKKLSAEEIKTLLGFSTLPQLTPLFIQLDVPINKGSIAQFIASFIEYAIRVELAPGFDALPADIKHYARDYLVHLCRMGEYEEAKKAVDKSYKLDVGKDTLTELGGKMLASASFSSVFEQFYDLIRSSEKLNAYPEFFPLAADKRAAAPPAQFAPLPQARAAIAASPAQLAPLSAPPPPPIQLPPIALPQALSQIDQLQAQLAALRDQREVDIKINQELLRCKKSSEADIRHSGDEDVIIRKQDGISHGNSTDVYVCPPNYARPRKVVIEDSPPLSPRFPPRAASPAISSSSRFSVSPRGDTSPLVRSASPRGIPSEPRVLQVAPQVGPLRVVSPPVSPLSQPMIQLPQQVVQPAVIRLPSVSGSAFFPALVEKTCGKIPSEYKCAEDEFCNVVDPAVESANKCVSKFQEGNQVYIGKKSALELLKQKIMQERQRIYPRLQPPSPVRSPAPLPVSSVRVSPVQPVKVSIPQPIVSRPIALPVAQVVQAVSSPVAAETQDLEEEEEVVQQPIAIAFAEDAYNVGQIEESNRIRERVKEKKIIREIEEECKDSIQQARSRIEKILRKGAALQRVKKVKIVEEDEGEEEAFRLAEQRRLRALEEARLQAERLQQEKEEEEAIRLAEQRRLAKQRALSIAREAGETRLMRQADVESTLLEEQRRLAKQEEERRLAEEAERLQQEKEEEEAIRLAEQRRLAKQLAKQRAREAEERRLMRQADVETLTKIQAEEGVRLAKQRALEAERLQQEKEEEERRLAEEAEAFRRAAERAKKRREEEDAKLLALREAAVREEQLRAEEQARIERELQAERDRIALEAQIEAEEQARIEAEEREEQAQVAQQLVMNRLRQVASEAAIAARRLEEARMKRQLEEQERLASELAKKKAEEARLEAELLRQQQEEEQARIEAEIAEQARLQAEAARAEQEQEEARARKKKKLAEQRDEKEEPKIQPSPMVVKGVVPTILFRPPFPVQEDRVLPFQLNSTRSLVSRSKLLSRLNKQ